jgi:hypothetical protein
MWRLWILIFGGPAWDGGMNTPGIWEIIFGTQLGGGGAPTGSIIKKSLGMKYRKPWESAISIGKILRGVAS